MTRRRVFVGVLALLAAIGAVVGAVAFGGSRPLGGFASLRAAAASVSRDCAATVAVPPAIGQSGLGEPALWIKRPRGSVVYWSTGHALLSSRGLRERLLPRSRFAYDVGLWPCRTPVAFFPVNGTLWMQSGAKSIALGPFPLNVNVAFDAHGGPVAPPPSPVPGWSVGGFVRSPATERSAAFLAEVAPPVDCTSDQDGRLYLVSPSASHVLDTYSPCTDTPNAGWSPDGSKFFWVRNYGSGITVSDASFRHRRQLVAANVLIGSVLWSPDGKRIAYTYRDGQVEQVAVVTVATGAVRGLTHIRWRPPPPPYYPPAAWVTGWSPDSASVLIAQRAAGRRRVGRTTIEGVPASGGPPRVFNRPKP